MVLGSSSAGPQKAEYRITVWFSGFTGGCTLQSLKTGTQALVLWCPCSAVGDSRVCQPVRGQTERVSLQWDLSQL